MDLKYVKSKIKKLKELKADKKELYWLIYTAGSYKNVDILKTDLNRLTKRNRNIISYESNIFYHMAPVLHTHRLDGTIVELYDQGDLASIRLSGEYSDLVSRSYLNKRNLTVENVNVKVINVDLDKINEIYELWGFRHILLMQQTAIQSRIRHTNGYLQTLKALNIDYTDLLTTFELQLTDCENKTQIQENFLITWDHSKIENENNQKYFNNSLGFVFDTEVNTIMEDLYRQLGEISSKIFNLDKKVEQLYLDIQLK